jgi:hypothetical protein
MKVTHKLIHTSKEYLSRSMMIPTIWLKNQGKKFDYVDIDIQDDKLIITPNFTKKPKKK